MTGVLLSIDTELSSSRHGAGMSLAENFALSIDAQTDEGKFGACYLSRKLKAHRLQASFFIDPMSALVFGTDILKRIAMPLLEDGHDVQLHVHTEWLAFLEKNPVGRTGRNMFDFPLAQQKTIISMALDLFRKSGLPEPVAFRAGNFGANNDTLSAVAACGISIDTSYHAGLADHACQIETDTPLLHPQWMAEGVTEYPVAVFRDFGAHVRGGQLCALSNGEMGWLLDNAKRENWPCVTLMLHSFELIHRPSARAHHLQIHRFDALCDRLAYDPDLTTMVFSDVPTEVTPLRQSLPRSPLPLVLRRVAEQAYGRLRYEL